MNDSDASIVDVRARQVLDSRGRPTVEVDVRLGDGSFGRAIAPSGASRGRHEAHELRDGENERFEGLTVHAAVHNVRTEITACLRGVDARDQRACDAAMVALDGTSNLARLGANAVLATSLALCRAAAVQVKLPLHAYINRLIDRRHPPTLPVPMTNILSGGAHAGRGMDFQDFLVVPITASSFAGALEMIARVRSEAARLMRQRGLSVLLADEGGLSPGFTTAREALDLMVEAIEAAGLRPGTDMSIAIDVAASELREGDRYVLQRSGQRLSSAEMAAHVIELVRSYPVVSVEDPLDQDDWDAWRDFTAGARGIQVIGDDLFATSPSRIRRGVEGGVANAALIKVNQNGTLSGTLDAMAVASEAGYASIVSARSGETEDTFIADLAVGTGAGQIKIGSVRTSERLAKYNQLLRIEEEGIPWHSR